MIGANSGGRNSTVVVSPHQTIFSACTDIAPFLLYPAIDRNRSRTTSKPCDILSHLLLSLLSADSAQVIGYRGLINLDRAKLHALE